MSTPVHPLASPRLGTSRMPGSRSAGWQPCFGGASQSAYRSPAWEPSLRHRIGYLLKELLFAPYHWLRGWMAPLPAFTRISNLPAVDIKRLREDVTALAKLDRSSKEGSDTETVVRLIESRLSESGQAVVRQDVNAGGRRFHNLITSFGPADAPRLIVGAHYDVDTLQYPDGPHPGADDNASGIAALLALSGLLKAVERQLKHRIDLVAFCNEEAPWFRSEMMGSAHHARQLKADNVPVLGMINLDTLGYYQDPPTPVPKWLRWRLPNHGQYVGVVSTLKSYGLVRQVQQGLKAGLAHYQSDLDVHSLAMPGGFFKVRDSDHNHYIKQGWPAVMITDTGPLRNPNYHRSSDLPGTLDYPRLARLVQAVATLLVQL